MEKIFRQFDDHEQARQADLEDDQRMTYEERFRIFLKMMEPYYAAAGRLQRIYRVDESGQRQIRDDWGVRL